MDPRVDLDPKHQHLDIWYNPFRLGGLLSTSCYRGKLGAATVLHVSRQGAARNAFEFDRSGCYVEYWYVASKELMELCLKSQGSILRTLLTIGQTYPSLLLQPTSDFAVITTANKTFLYYYASAPSAIPDGSSLSIYELALPSTGVDASRSLSNAIPVTNSSTVIQQASPNTTEAYLPLSAIASATTITVCFTGGLRAGLSGYSSLQCTSRAIGNTWSLSAGDATQLELPLQ